MTSELSTRVARLNDVLCSVNALQWDARVMMPRGGAETRGHQLATLKGIAREMILDPAMEAAAEAALGTGEDAAAQAVLAARRW
ncbi:carboxypeptidase M32, partial [Yangia mangrovi]|nr:carboxypeptidase M32 [Alloyangia mangrovi]